MFQIVVSSIILSIIHASIPNHWLPLVAIGKLERWDKKTTLLATAISGLAHIASTVLIGIFIGWAGYKLSSVYTEISTIVAPAILVALGIWYVLRGLTKHHSHNHFGQQPAPNASFTSVVVSLSIGMFFSPCIELESYYFTAGTMGWQGIIAVSIIYLFTTVACMVLFVSLAIEGINRFNFTFLEKHDKTIIGAILMAVGIITYVVNL